MMRDETDEGHNMQQRVDGDTSEVLSPAGLFAAEVAALAAAITDLPTFPALLAAQAKLSECIAARDAAEAELNANGRLEPAANGGKLPDKRTLALIDKRDRAEEARQKATLAVHRERDAAQAVLSEHVARHATECSEILGEVSIILDKLASAMMKANAAAESYGRGHGFHRAPTLVSIAWALKHQ